MPGRTYFESLKAYVGFTDDSTALLREMHPLVLPHVERIMDDFYDTIEAHPGARQSITGGEAQIARLKTTLQRWLEETLYGPHDEDYFQRRARIGRVHVRINLPQAYMLTAMNRIRVQVSELISEALHAEPERLEGTLKALHQIIDIELAIMLETYREDLEAKNRTAERLATIGQFAAGIGHELRNPLGVVATSVFLLRQRLQQESGALDPKVERHLEKIATEVRRSTATINDLLELARDKPPKRRQVSLVELLEAAVSIAALPATIDVRLEVAPGATATVDPDQIGRVLTNLMLNACQALEGKGAGRIVLGAERSADELRIRVRDDGPGVAEEIRPRIFEALFTTKAKGTGLGLALCRRIAEAHGGSLVLEPSSTGASFLLTVPQPGAEPRAA